MADCVSRVVSAASPRATSRVCSWLSRVEPPSAENMKDGTDWHPRGAGGGRLEGLLVGEAAKAPCRAWEPRWLALATCAALPLPAGGGAEAPGAAGAAAAAAWWSGGACDAPGPRPGNGNVRPWRRAPCPIPCGCLMGLGDATIKDLDRRRWSG